MMREWINLLPLFIVKRLARRQSEVVYVGTKPYFVATKGVLIEWLPKN